jgi:hypothetical protein
MTNQVKVGGLGGWMATILSFCLLVLGMSLLFVSAQVCVLVFGRADIQPIAPLLGAAVFGIGAMNWIGRHSTLGGIYSRPVVVANQVHFFVGAMILIKHAAAVGGTGAFYLLTIFYVIGAVWYGYLLYSPGVKRA